MISNLFIGKVHTAMCYDYVHIILFQYAGNMFSRFSKAFASECLEDIEEMFLQYYMHSDVCNRFKISIILYTKYIV